jgi:hypothetical protein
MLKHHRSSLSRLAAGTPKEKAGLVRCLHVSMETACLSGQTMQDVWHTLEVPGNESWLSCLSSDFRAGEKQQSSDRAGLPGEDSAQTFRSNGDNQFRTAVLRPIGERRLR